jgi:predicted  nucleic acid-binding Zn-ribbon protein
MKRNTTNVTIEKNVDAPKQTYSYYSRVLEKPFDTIEELAAAEAAHYEKLKAKEDAAAQKKADAAKVEDAFKALNTARKTYKDDITQLTAEYAESLENLKKAFDLGKKDIANKLAEAEAVFDEALKAFQAKYPEGYHLTLKDGDFETTISSQSTNDTVKTSADFPKLADSIFNMLFGW